MLRVIFWAVWAVFVLLLFSGQFYFAGWFLGFIALPVSLIGGVIWIFSAWKRLTAPHTFNVRVTNKE